MLWKLNRPSPFRCKIAAGRVAHTIELDDILCRGVGHMCNCAMQLRVMASAYGGRRCRTEIAGEVSPMARSGLPGISAQRGAGSQSGPGRGAGHEKTRLAAGFSNNPHRDLPR